MPKSAIIIGAGIVGLATARALALKRFDVTVIERSGKAVGASVRNFGMIWPIGQPSGKMYNRALRSKSIWKEICNEAGIWYDECGSLHLAYHEDEWTVLKELEASFNSDNRLVKLMELPTIEKKFNGVNTANLKGGLFSETELIIDPREAIAKLPGYLSGKYNINFIWNKSVIAAESNRVHSSTEILQADIICICSGADFETLYPEKFNALQLTKCKLQMMRFVSTDKQFSIGTSLCGGLSLIHYESFKSALSLQKLKERYERELGEYLRLGIHVMVSQNRMRELTVGDSHEYGLTFDPFDDTYVNDLIINYLRTFAITDNWKLIQSWHGVYPKMTDGNTDILLQAEDNIYIVNGLGGAGMTLSFGFAEEAMEFIM